MFTHFSVAIYTSTDTLVQSYVVPFDLDWAIEHMINLATYNGYTVLDWEIL